MTGSLELRNKHYVSGGVKLATAFAFTLFIAFGLDLGSDIYLLFDESKRQELKAIKDGFIAAPAFRGFYEADDMDATINPGGALMFSGPMTYSIALPVYREHLVAGCYRPPEFPWYLQSWPWWAQFFVVPLFATVSSLCNLQPWKSVELFVMVLIACVGYIANKVADYLIFERSEVVSAIGAFSIGLLANLYSRVFGGTALTSMITGVLFLVPVSTTPSISSETITHTYLSLHSPVFPSLVVSQRKGARSRLDMRC